MVSYECFQLVSDVATLRDEVRIAGADWARTRDGVIVDYLMICGSVIALNRGRKDRKNVK